MLLFRSRYSAALVTWLQMLLREIGADNFSYTKFKTSLAGAKTKFNPDQLSGLEQRMSLLESFLEKGSKRTSVEARFEEGQLTIVDLTDPFIDAGHANALFEIVTRLFQRTPLKTGKVLVVDEAHKVGRQSSVFLVDVNDFVHSTVPLRRDPPRRFPDDHDQGTPAHWDTDHH